MSKAVFVSPNPRIKLKPADWFWASWRDLPPLPRPAAPPFDQAEACRRIVNQKAFNYYWQWEKLKISPVLTRQEAHFWLAFIGAVLSRKSSDPQALMERFRQDTFDGRVTLDEAKDYLFAAEDIKARPFYNFPELAIPLLNLFDWKELVTGISQWAPLSPSMMMQVIEGFQQCALPYLAVEERETLRHAVAEALASPCISTLGQWVGYGVGNKVANPLLYLAALIGGFDDILLNFVQSQLCPSVSRYAIEAIYGLSDPGRVEAEIRARKLHLRGPEEARAWLAHTETKALDWLRSSIELAYNKRYAEQVFRVLALVEDPAAVPQMLALRQGKRVANLAHDWLTKHLELAAPELARLAVSDDSLASDALPFLRSIKARGEEELLKTAVAQLDAAGQAKLASLLGERQAAAESASTPAWLSEALKRVPGRQPALFLDYAELPPLVVDGYPLNRAEGNALLGAISQSDFGRVQPLVTAVKQQANAATLDAWAWNLFETWQKMGGDNKGKWTLTAVGLLGNDSSVLKLTPLIRKWPGESQHNRAVLGLRCLQAIGSDIALMQINGIAQKVPFRVLKQEAQRAMEAIAGERGMTAEELGDRIVPDCGLDESSRRVFEYGRRRFTFVLSPEMKPLARDEAGKLLENLPKPGAKDDKALAEPAYADWQMIKKQVREVAKVQASRLEQAMVYGRRWTAAEFATLLVNHPLQFHLVRLLLWGVYDPAGKLQFTFRVTDEKDFANQADDGVKLDGAAQVGIVHPLHLDGATKVTWGELFSDYELVSPFPQLGREVYGLTADEADAQEITRFAQAKLHPAAMVGTLEKLGWRRGYAQDAGIFSEHSKAWPAHGVTAVVNYPGVPMGILNDWEEQHLERCIFAPKALGAYGRYEKQFKLGTIDPIVMSEVLRDLHIVVSKAQVS